MADKKNDTSREHNDKHELMMNIYRRAQDYPEGPTKENIFKETVHHVVIDKFYGLFKNIGDNNPTNEDLAKCLLETAELVHKNNPSMISHHELEKYKEWLKENAHKFRKLYERTAN